MSSERLLKRIRQWERKEQTQDTDVLRFVESVVDDLTKLLNTQRSAVLVSDDMGLPDYRNLFNSYSAPDLGAVAEEIKRTITRHEQRMKNVVIEQSEEMFSGVLKWTMQADLSAPQRVIAIAAEISLAADGRISIEYKG